MEAEGGKSCGRKGSALQIGAPQSRRGRRFRRVGKGIGREGFSGGGTLTGGERGKRGPDRE